MTRSLTIFLCVPVLFLGELSVISFQHSGPSVSPNGLLMRFWPRMSQDTELNCQNCYNVEINGGHNVLSPSYKSWSASSLFQFAGENLFWVMQDTRQCRLVWLGPDLALAEHHAWSVLGRGRRGDHGWPGVTTGYKCQIGLVWLSSYFESILALDLKNHLFVQILFEFFFVNVLKSII